MNKEIRIVIVDLAAYNAGKLHGVWIDATDELDDIQDQINTLLAQSPVADAEAYAIHYHEGFNGYNLGEHEGIKAVHEMACFIKDYPKIGGELLNYFSDIDEARRTVEENYCGCYKTLAEYAEEFTEESIQRPKELAFYIDYEKMGRDMALSNDICTIETGFEEIHIFWNC